MTLSPGPNIAVVCGGRSPEADVSRVSGTSVAQALRSSFANVALLELDHDIVNSLLQQGIDVVFPALHGTPGEDGSFQGLLEILDIPYVGSGVSASACALNKSVARQIFKSAGLRIAPGLVFTKFSKNLYTSEFIIDTLGPEVVIKPLTLGSAIGVNIVKGKQEIAQAMKVASGFDDSVLVEKRINGKEITVAVLERDGIETLPVIEILTPENTWYDYKHRYTPGASEHVIPARLTRAQYIKAQEMAKLAHLSLNCRDLSRVDLIVPANEEPVLLELNTLPGMTPTSLYPDAAGATGMSFESLVELLVLRALSRKKPTTESNFVYEAQQ